MNFQRFALALTAAACMAGLPAFAQTSTSDQPGTTNETGTMSQPGTATQPGYNQSGTTGQSGVATEPGNDQSGAMGQSGVATQQGNDQSGTVGQSGVATQPGLNQTGTMNQPGAVNESGTMNQGFGTFPRTASRYGREGWNNPANYGRRGSHSAAIRRVQRQLRADGYYRGRIDGIAGPQFHAAIRRFQRDENLRATGTLNSATLRRLGVGRGMGYAGRSANRSGCIGSASRYHGHANRSWNRYGRSANRYGNFSNGSANRMMNGTGIQSNAPLGNGVNGTNPNEQNQGGTLQR